MQGSLCSCCTEETLHIVSPCVRMTFGSWVELELLLKCCPFQMFAVQLFSFFTGRLTGQTDVSMVKAVHWS